MAAGWTVSAVLAHLAFWDLRAIVSARQMQQQHPGPSPMDTECGQRSIPQAVLWPSSTGGSAVGRRDGDVLDQKIERLEPAFIHCRRIALMARRPPQSWPAPP